MNRAGLLTFIVMLSVCFKAIPDVVNENRLLEAHKEPGGWLTYGRDYSNQRFSPLSQINRETVRRLVPRWIYQTGISASFQATPLMVDGVIYLSMPFDHVSAISATTGEEIWRYEHQRVTSKMCCGPANRGVAVAHGKVFVGTVDARLLALDKATGKPVWDVPMVTASGPTETVEQLGAGKGLREQTATGTTGVGLNMAPLVVNGKVIIGITGVGYGLHLEAETPGAPVGTVVGFPGKFGRSGFYAAFDVHTGKRVWQFDTVPDTGWEGDFRAATPDGIPLPRNIAEEKQALSQFPSASKYGGGSAWTTPAFDAGTNTLFVGIGNPSPQMDDSSRPGDNLYTVSLAALDADTGTLRWHFQQVPHDLWGYDVASPPVLFDYPASAGLVEAVGQASKTGWFYVHNRTTGELLYKSEPFVPQENLFAPPTEAGTRIAPGAIGGASWSPVALNPVNGLAYVAASHVPVMYTVKSLSVGNGRKSQRYTELKPVDGPQWGTLTAISTRDNGMIRWQKKTDQPLVGGVLATAGDLVFMGEGNGHLNAFDAETGELLWQFQCGAGVNAPPVTYEVNGVQYIAVAAGGNSLFGFKGGGALIVFALPLVGAE